MATGGKGDVCSDVRWEKKTGIYVLGNANYAVAGPNTQATAHQLKRFMDKAKATEGISRTEYDTFDALRSDVMESLLEVNSKLSRIEPDKDRKKSDWPKPTS